MKEKVVVKDNKIPKLVVLFIFIIFGGVGIVLGWYVGTKLADKENESEQKVTDNYTKPTKVSGQLTYSFLQLENNKENMVYSPLSIKYALKMLELGADGNTKTELSNVLKDQDVTKYNDIKDNVSLANAIFIKDEYKDNVKENFIKENKEKYNTEIKYDKFENVDNVNKWVSDKTFGLIPKLLNESNINPNTELILTNALAIQMSWAEPFRREDTYGEPFYLTDGTEYIATTLKRNAKSASTEYYKDDEITALKMDLDKYENTQLEFIAIMPNDLDKYIKNITNEEIEELNSKLIKTNTLSKGVEISIPRFKFDYQLKLTEDLKELGIKDAFSDKADLTKIGETGLYVSDTVHKAVIDFSEEGVKAAAATAVVVSDKAVLPEDDKTEIKFNRPFMFIIRDKENKETWFVGTVYKPNSWKTDIEEYYPER